MTVMSSMNETALARLCCSKERLDFILAVLLALTQPLPNLLHLMKTRGLEVPVRTDLIKYRTTEGTISASAGSNLWRYMLLRRLVRRTREWCTPLRNLVLLQAP